VEHARRVALRDDGRDAEEADEHRAEHRSRDRGRGVGGSESQDDHGHEGHRGDDGVERAIRRARTRGSMNVELAIAAP
jgi:hypothetical protein